MIHFMEKEEQKTDFHQLCSSGQKPAAFLISQLIFFFFLASIGGFLWEVMIFLIKDGCFRNRGFFYGPWLPVYGAGAVIFYLLLSKPIPCISHSQPAKKYRRITVFFFSMLTGTLLELIIGYFLDTVWSLRYWDYREYFLNFNGYICLASALGFGIAGTIWVCSLSGFLTRLWQKLPETVRSGINTLLVLLFLIDCAASLVCPNTGNGITFPR